MVAFPMGVIAATLLVLAWSKWSGAMEDIESGDLIRVTGTLTLTDKTTNYEWSSRRSCKLIMGGTQLPISADVADAVRASPAVKARKKSNNLFTNTSGDEIAFMGTVDYAPRSSLLLSIRMANGRLVWQHSGLSSDAGTGTT